jgi:hypothetical protein
MLSDADQLALYALMSDMIKKTYSKETEAKERNKKNAK